MSPFLSIARLLREGRAPDHPVAFGRSGTCDFADLEADVAALLARMAPAGGPWLLHSDDPYAAGVGLLACAQAGIEALLAPNRLPETLRRLRGEVVGALIDPGPAEALSGLPALPPLGGPRAAPPDWKQPEADAPWIGFLTSGTTGESKIVPKQLRHLDDEVRELERLFGSRVGDGTRFFASVSQQHVYGLLFRVLWPLAAGRPFSRDTFLHASELVSPMRAAERCVLVTSPAHLKRMRASEALGRLRGVCRAVFSSGGPLDAASAGALRAALGEAPHEILGSTETGGVAHRQRSPGADPDAWTPFGPVSVRREPAEGRLEVSSPFASLGAPSSDGRRRRFRMGDRIERLGADRFRLLGRADRVVNIGGHRLSLPEMEVVLANHPLVEETVLVPLERGGEERIHAVVVPSPSGWGAVHERGRRAVSGELSEHLAGHYSRVLLPRAWRFAEALPRDAQGKAPVARLRALFEPESAGGVRDPTCRSERRGDGWLERDLAVPHDLAYLEGHFPGRPIVAAVVQVRWALEAARRLLGSTPRVLGFEALKFARVLAPGDAFTLRVERAGADDSLRFELRDGAHRVSSGRCLLAADGGAP